MYYKMVQCTIGPILAFGFVLQNGTVYNRAYSGLRFCITKRYSVQKGPIWAFGYVFRNGSVYCTVYNRAYSGLRLCITKWVSVQ